MRRVVFVIVVLAGCASSSDDDGRNDADVAFAVEVDRLDTLAVDLAARAEGRASEDVALLATSVAEDASARREVVRAWLEEWDEDPVEAPAPVVGDVSGEAFDRTFLGALVDNRSSVVVAAQAELDAGEDPAALALAAELVDLQSTEVDELSGLLAEYDG